MLTTVGPKSSKRASLTLSSKPSIHLPMAMGELGG